MQPFQKVSHRLSLLVVTHKAFNRPFAGCWQAIECRKQFIMNLMDFSALHPAAESFLFEKESQDKTKAVK
jgi:hypothetical protein